ncbi:MAG TPA: carbohydrate ABC transporter permease [Aggregatilineales bacterium]|nr:carbohydrate ABC transporter permease [Aggregatilineales bacterium]
MSLPVRRIPTYALMILIGAIHIIPFYILVNLATKSPQDVSSKWTPPSYLFLDNFTNAWQNATLDKALINNIIITSSTVAIVIIIGALAAYPLSRFPTRLNNFVYTLSISFLIVPALTILVPLYKLMVDIGGINTYWGVILCQVTFFLPITIFIFTGFMRAIPRELDEAGLIDGCSRFEIFFRIIMPLLNPAISTVVILVGLGVWNDYQFSIFFLQKRQVQTVPVALSQFISQFQSNINWVAAGALLSALPIVIVYIFLQKYLIKGLTEGAIKA